MQDSRPNLENLAGSAGEPGPSLGVSATAVGFTGNTPFAAPSTPLGTRLERALWLHSGQAYSAIYHGLWITRVRKLHVEFSHPSPHGHQVKAGTARRRVPLAGRSRSQGNPRRSSVRFDSAQRTVHWNGSCPDEGRGTPNFVPMNQACHPWNARIPASLPE